MSTNQLYAHMFNAPKRTGYKIQMIICESQNLADAGRGPNDDEKFFDTKAEAKQWAKDRSATPHNY